MGMPVTNVEPRRDELEARVKTVLRNADKPLTHDELAKRLDIEPDQAGDIVSELVIDNQISTNANWEYKLL